MTIHISWSIAKAALIAGNNALRAVRAYALLVGQNERDYTTKDDLFQTYADLGVSRTTAYRDIRQLTRPQQIGRSVVYFAGETDEEAPRLVRTSMYKLTAALGMK